MASISTTDVAPVLREFYGEKGVPNTAYEENALFAMTTKKRITGKYIDYPIQYGHAANRSRTGSTALTRPNVPKYVEFNVPTVADYDSIGVEKKALAECKDEGAFLDLLTNAIDSVTKNLGNQAGADAFNHRGAARGQVGSVTTTSLVLKNIEDVVHFEVGAEIRSSEANGLSGSLQSGSATVTAIDRDTGTLTTDSDWTAQIASLDADDFLFADGDFGIGRAGLADWCPDSTSGLGTAFYGATRSVDATRLAGIRVDGANLPIGHAIRKACARGGREGVRFTHAWMSYNTMNQFVTELDNKVQYVQGESTKDASVGFKGIEISGGNSNVKCFADRSAPDDKIYLLKQESFECIHSQESPVKIDDLDGNILSREASAFAYDIRGAAFLNYRMKNPSDAGVVTGL